MRDITFTINGETVTVKSTLSRRLLDVIRIDLGLTGTKEGCGEGECGACQVYLDGKIVNSCLVPMSNVIGREVQTIEGFSKTESYKKIEKAYIEEGAVQCGFCTPGMVMATNALLSDNAHPNSEEIKEGLAGNICRCTGYQTIFKAVKKLASEEEK
ncbi:MAG: (2Fe-2S)-binding protein [Clostridiales bacterium]|nr:(2Fe-2S)-binding protein [Clostridiales bacterium]